MKTIEDQAKEYVVKSGALDAGCSIDVEDAYKQGAMEAQRWISVKDELPEADTPCIVKNKVDNMCICFMKYQKMNNDSIEPIGWFNYWYGRSSTKTAEPISAKITHWRYIVRY